MTFKSDRYFKLWIYTVSHSTLIIRSEKQYPDVEYSKNNYPNNTIDIEFSGVEHLSIPHKFDRLKIEKKGDRYIFNDNSAIFIDAASCIIGTSSWDEKDRIKDMNLEYDQILLSF